MSGEEDKAEYREMYREKKQKKRKKGTGKKEERKKEKKRREKKKKNQNDLSTCCPVQPHLHQMLFRNLSNLEVESLTVVGSLPASAA